MRRWKTSTAAATGSYIGYDEGGQLTEPQAHA